MHGKTSGIIHDGRSIFRGMPSPFEATRYHSLIVEEASFPAALEISARTQKGEIMGLRHRELAVEGVQFHPESILTDHGLRMIEVPVQMRVRETGSSSITALRSVYYMVKVLLALFIGLFRRYSTPLEEP